MGFLDTLKGLLQKKKQEPPKREVEKHSRPYSSIKEIRRTIIAQRNIERRKQSQYRHSKFFKQRQSTTARKLWKPDKRPED